MCILLSERRQYEKAIYCMIPALWHSKKDKTIVKVKRSVVATGYGEGKDEYMEHRGFLG